MSGHTHTHTYIHTYIHSYILLHTHRTTTVTLDAHARRGLMQSTKVQTLGIPTRMRNISTMTSYVEDCTAIKISWQCGTKIMTCGNVSEALMLAMRVLFCSSLSKVCSCVSEALMFAMRVLLLSCLLNVSSRDSKALLRFEGLLAVMRTSLFKVKA